MRADPTRSPESRTTGDVHTPGRYHELDTASTTSDWTHWTQPPVAPLSTIRTRFADSVIRHLHIARTDRGPTVVVQYRARLAPRYRETARARQFPCTGAAAQWTPSGTLV